MTPVILISCAESRDSITTTAVEPLTETVIEMRSWLATPLIATAASVPLPTKRNCTSPLGTPSTAKPPRSSTTDVSEVPVTWTDRPDAWARMSVPALMPITLPVMDARPGRSMAVVRASTAWWRWVQGPSRRSGPAGCPCRRRRRR